LIRVDRDTVLIVETDTVHGTDKGQPYTLGIESERDLAHQEPGS
jgi:hypothetical protein